MSFAAQIGRWGKKTMDKNDAVRRAVILKLFTSIIRDTPVLTGRLRGSWRCSVGHPNLSVNPPDTINSPANAIASVVSAAASSKGSDVVVLSNALPYVFPIEYEGHSKKSPGGMVRRNIARFRQLIKSEIQTLS